MSKYLYPIFTVFLAVFSVSCEWQNQKDSPITIAISPWAGYSFALLAMDLGYLKVNNKEQVNLIIYPSLSESRIAYANGNVDGMFSTMIEVIESAQQENKIPSVLLVTNFSNGPDQILAKKDIKTIYDLKGKNIGVEQASIGMYMLNRALDIHNIPYNEFSLVYMGAENMKKALVDNTIDAAITYPPYVQNIKRLAPNKIFHSGMIQDEIIDLLAIEKQTIKNHPKQVEIFINGWIKAYEFYKKNPNKANRIIHKYPEFAQIDLSKDLKEITLINYSNQSDFFSSEGVLKKSFNNITSLMKKHNLILHEIDVNDIIDENVLGLYPKAKQVNK